GDVLVAGEVPGQRPAVGDRVTEVGEVDIAGEAGAPLVDRVRDAAAGRRARLTGGDDAQARGQDEGGRAGEDGGTKSHVGTLLRTETGSRSRRNRGASLAARSLSMTWERSHSNRSEIVQKLFVNSPAGVRLG